MYLALMLHPVKFTNTQGFHLHLQIHSQARLIVQEQTHGMELMR